MVNQAGKQIDFYIYEYDILSERVEKAYEKYLAKPKRDGGQKKDIEFRLYDLKFLQEDDHAGKNNWGILGF